MTSGTLAYSFGLGRVVVSTPYWHAQELLAEGRGVLTPFGDSAAIGSAISDLLRDPERRAAMAVEAHRHSRSMTWARSALDYLDVFEQACAVPVQRPRLIPLETRALRDTAVTPAASCRALMALSDDVGIYQHAVHSVPDRGHGYCVDDNARALLVACALDDPLETALPERQVDAFAAFVQHAWNPDCGRFRNFMSFDRRWLEPAGSEDSHGRTLWALGVCARDSGSLPRRAWAAHLFRAAAHPVTGFESPRAWAFTLLGLDGFCAKHPNVRAIEELRQDLGERLMTLLMAHRIAAWPWFEPCLSYDNARLCEALILTGEGTGAPALTKAGLGTLTWLVSQQRGTDGVFRPVGSDTFGEVGVIRPYDQQPLEAAATIAACRAAWRATGQGVWIDEARRALDWFHGSNDLGIALVDEDTGSCRDGLHPDRANENRGGESVVSFLLATTDMRRLQRDAALAADARRALAETA
jgi:hypothetical protein